MRLRLMSVWSFLPVITVLLVKTSLLNTDVIVLLDLMVCSQSFDTDTLSYQWSDRSTSCSDVANDAIIVTLEVFIWN